MSQSLSDEHDQLRTGLRRFLSEKAGSSEVRRLMATDEGNDPALWTQMSGQLGLQGLPIPEQHGGAGYGPVELGIVLEELGRALLPSPFFATVALAAQALMASDDEAAQARYLPGIADGTTTATLVVGGADGGWNLQRVTTRAELTGDGWTVTGGASFVVDGHTADLLLVVARTHDGLGLFAVAGADSRVARTKLDVLDQTRPLARVELDAAPGLRIGPAGDGAAFLQRALDLAVVALAAEQVGGAQRCLEMAVEYAKVRVQFGRPIGSFQAIKHKCADMLLDIESARSAASHASSVAGDPEELAIAAALAGAYCSTAYTRVSKENIQIHGGIGYTWEHDAHLYLKRAKSSELLFGAPPEHRVRLAELVGI